LRDTEIFWTAEIYFILFGAYLMTLSIARNEWGRKRMRIGYWWESQKERDHWEDEGVGGWTILKWILER
jgi:hypothetical protein